MLHSEIEEYASWKSMKCAAALAAMAVLGSCAVAVPLRPLATSSHSSLDDDFACTANPRCTRMAERMIGLLIIVYSPLAANLTTVHPISF